LVRQKSNNTAINLDGYREMRLDIFPSPESDTSVSSPFSYFPLPSSSSFLPSFRPAFLSFIRGRGKILVNKTAQDEIRTGWIGSCIFYGSWRSQWPNARRAPTRGVARSKPSGCLFNGGRVNRVLTTEKVGRRYSARTVIGDLGRGGR
jgi:hypothetical protein